MIKSIDSLKEHKRPGLPVILLAGPTASGKTDLSLGLAERLRAEIINADSMQIYRYMDIGTAKPTAAERQLIHHHLIDVAFPDEPFDAAKYLETARPIIQDLHARGILPIVVGGTGLYMKVLTRGICPGPPSDPALKETLRAEAESKGLAQLHLELSEADPQAALRIHQNDRQRILRALEVFRLSGVPLSRWQSQHGFEETLFPTIKIFIHRERDELYSRINRRVDQMIEEGLKDEVEGLFSMGYGPHLKSMQSLGYRQMADHILKGTPLDQTVYLIKRETRHYAKRQITWFKADPEFSAFQADDAAGIYSWLSAALSLSADDAD